MMWGNCPHNKHNKFIDFFKWENQTDVMYLIVYLLLKLILMLAMKIYKIILNYENR